MNAGGVSKACKSNGVLRTQLVKLKVCKVYKVFGLYNFMNFKNFVTCVRSAQWQTGE